MRTRVRFYNEYYNPLRDIWLRGLSCWDNAATCRSRRDKTVIPSKHRIVKITETLEVIK